MGDNDFSNKKIYFVDFDNTIYLHDNKGSITETEYRKTNLEYGLGYRQYYPESLNTKLINALEKCVDNNTKIILLTGCTFNKCLEAKKNIIEEKTSIFSDFFSVAQKEDKIDLMKIYADAYNMPKKNITLIDDDLDICKLADAFGFNAFTPSQFIEKKYVRNEDCR
jgi:hypothetical protein